MSTITITEPISSPVSFARKTPQAEQKTSKDLWFIHGKYYDLTAFIESHPGGTTVLNMCKGLEDATPCMESYHAFANREYIYKTMAKYEVSYTPADAETRVKTDTKYLFEQDGFYMTLVRRVRAHFGSTKESESVTKNIKDNVWWNIKVSFLSLVYVTSFLLAFFVPNVPLSPIVAAVAGSSFIMVGFTAMHDASHYALGVRDSWKNKIVLRVWNSLALWDSAKWLYHHMVRHHSFTGDLKLDPDVVHAAPMIRKNKEADISEYTSNSFLPVDRSSSLYAQIQTAFYATVLDFGQLFYYNIKWNFTGLMWGLPLEKTKNVFTKYWWEYGLSALILFAQVYKADPLVTLAFFTAQSISYGMCILADHDTFESAVENHVAGGEKDWGEIQVRHSSDFAAKGMWGYFFGEVFGSINVQIAHHLFPSVNHVHLRGLIPVIRQTCEEFNIPYASHDTLFGALISVSKALQTFNQDMVEKEKAKKH